MTNAQLNIHSVDLQRPVHPGVEDKPAMLPFTLRNIAGFLFCVAATRWIYAGQPRERQYKRMERRDDDDRYCPV
ncbi:hypothetical protein HUR95_04605 [Caldalkalibacillus thermarum TA2.A1]|uniref:Uncharacterized protein n=1 Tax=Caldalkalibacillus thermarum (strain TA2.A1) TaxID=986075 RepID=A0A8X8LB69_CALTT|nr:hypothetical protein [Caldalkalibacillus thermarum]QZT34628.1 hypothetical protein HUR95_04605 [Caldalkalibacillus thermarum TA2.A1]